VEDTTLYVYNRLLSLNEVGGNPSHFGISVADFHSFNQKHQTTWPHTMNATATHDTKRGEDVRTRLNVLSELPEEWEEQVNIWSHYNQGHRSVRNGFAMPDRNDEYFLYQTLVGAFPFAEHEHASFVERVKDYMIKSIREAKVHTAWLRPDSEYEEACTSFVEKVLNPSISGQFLEAFHPLQEKIAYYGMFNSLSQTLLKTIAPGVPDFYQGTELWELSLVDPDNRRPVDFEQRRTYLSNIKEQIKTDILGLIQELLDHKTDGRIKLFLTAQLLQARTDYLSLFQDGDYLPLEIQGTHANHIIAFGRQLGKQTAIAIAPRFLTRLIQPGENPLGEVWENTHLQLPPRTSSSWKNVLTQQSLDAKETLSIGSAFAHFPVALLISSAD
jgi:(1->4)-alpha-D-glucan 1-alpha-D-glucosylmutase